MLPQLRKKKRTGFAVCPHLVDFVEGVLINQNKLFHHEGPYLCYILLAEDVTRTRVQTKYRRQSNLLLWLSKCLILGKIVNDQKATVEFFHGLPFPESAAKGFFQRKVAMYDDLDMMWNS